MEGVFENVKEWLKKNDVRTWRIKYVRFADGKVLFCNSCDFSTNHFNIVESRPEVPAVSAGSIKGKGKGWYIDGYGSTTAKLKNLPSDEKYINMALEPLGFEVDYEILESIF